MANQEEVHLEKSIVVNKNRNHLFKMWKNYEALPLIFDFLEEVTALDENHSIWSILIDGSERVSWDTEITEEVQNQLIRWHSQGSAEVLHEGALQFTSAENNISTRINLQLHFYFPPMQDSKPDMLGEDLSNRIEHDLLRFKIAVEANQFPKMREIRAGLPKGFPGSNPIQRKDFY